MSLSNHAAGAESRVSRDVPFKRDAVCDDCGAKGAFDFMGDYLCPACSEKAIPSEDDCDDYPRSSGPIRGD